MPKGNINVVHDELIWKDHIKVRFKIYPHVNIYSFVFQESERKSRKLGKKLGLHKGPLLKHAGNQDPPAVVIPRCRKRSTEKKK